MPEAWIVPVFWAWVTVAVVTFSVLFFTSAPYGRHEREGWGPKVPARLGWIIMEAPSFFLIVALYAASDARGPLPTIAVGLWGGHYAYRSFVYPFLARLTGKEMPALIAALAIVFNLANAGFNGLVLFYGQVSEGWGAVLGIHAVLGLVLFAIGFTVHVHSDHVLRTLRAPGETGYRIPNRGLHRWVSSPNYLGECAQWAGFALLTWNLASLSFFIWTAANLVPRAHRHAQWYRETFTDYPEERRIIIPFVW